MRGAVSAPGLRASRSKGPTPILEGLAVMNVSRQRRQSLRAACAAVSLAHNVSRALMEPCERRILFAVPSDPTLSPLSAVPVLNSRPGAQMKLYLDFNG